MYSFLPPRLAVTSISVACYTAHYNNVWFQTPAPATWLSHTLLHRWARIKYGSRYLSFWT